MESKWIKRISSFLLATAVVVSLTGCGQTKPQEMETDVQEEATVNEKMTGVNQIIDQLATDAGLAPLSMDVNLKPVGALSEVTTTATYSDGKAVFSYQSEQTSVEYIIDTNREGVKKGLIEILTAHNGGEPVQSVMDAGTGYTKSDGKSIGPVQYAEAAEVEMKVDFDKSTGHLYLDYTETYEGVTNTKRYDFFMLGKSLAVHVTSPSQNGVGGYTYFSTGGAKGLTQPRIDNSIYCEEVSITLLEDEYFLSAYIDKAKTFATRVANSPNSDKFSTYHGMTAYYDLNSAGQTNPLNELFYVTVSDEFLDCAYLTNGEKSQYRDMLNDLVIYDNWNFTSTYSGRKESYTKLVEEYGLEDILLVEHRWQRDTLDVSNPAHFPASTQWGSADEFEDYITTVKDALGWKLALHEDYWFIQPSRTNQYWNDVENVEERVAQEANGELRIGWTISGSDYVSYANLSNMMAKYAAQESNAIEQNYDPDASFLDVNGGVDPSKMNQVTLNANSSTSRTLAQVVADNALLFQTVRDIYGGPVISEGAQGARSFGSAYAGFLDSGSREITDCSECRIMPNYELEYIRGKMANQGMGPPARFQVVADVETYDFDKLNATTLAYGHAGFIGDTHYSTPLLEDELVKVYYMFRAIQPQYLDSSVTVEEIAYFDAAGNKMNLDQAVLAGYDFRQARLYIHYSNGLEMYLNFAPENWEVTINGNDYILDQNGYAAENPSQNFVQYSCLRDGNRVDFVACDLYTYANPRGKKVDFGNGMVTATTLIQTDAGTVELGTISAAKEDSILFTDLVAEENGANGLTFYYTDGQTLTPFSQPASGYSGWVRGDEGVLVYPDLIAADNYGVAGTSATEYVAMGYKLPDTGIIDLFSWTVLQGPSGEHGYTVKIALDTLDNVVAEYSLQGDTQQAVGNTFSLEVTAGQELLMIYEPIVWKNEEWFGYKTHLTYMAKY